MVAVPDPEYPVGTWGPDDTPAHLLEWDQPVDPPDVPGFTATELGIPETITIHGSDSKPPPIYEICTTNAQVVIPHPDCTTCTFLQRRALLQRPRGHFPSDSDALDTDFDIPTFLTHQAA